MIYWLSRLREGLKSPDPKEAQRSLKIEQQEKEKVPWSRAEMLLKMGKLDNSFFYTTSKQVSKRAKKQLEKGIDCGNAVDIQIFREFDPGSG